MAIKITLFAVMLIASFASGQVQLTQYVNPFIGTANHGHTYPGATVPFGMVQLSPDNGHGGWDWCSGYNYSDSLIKGFSHTHLSGTGIGDLCDILFMPTTTDLLDSYSSRFSHDHESAVSGYYSVDLLSTGINVELTATTHAGFHRYTFPASSSSKVIIDLGYHINWDAPVESQINIVNDSLVTGYRFSTGWAKNQRIYFAARFSKTFGKHLLGTDSTLQSGLNSFTSKGVKGVVEFNTTEGEHVLVKVGISAVGIDGALNNLDAEIPDWDFEVVRKRARDQWEHQLEKVEVTSDSRPLKETFYTALYHTMLAPIVYEDVDGRYRGGDDSIHSAKNFTNYTIFSLWDTFRAAHPLFTILQPERINDFVNSLITFSKEFGSLPIWTLQANETFCMIGYHSVPVIADAYLKGFHGFDAEGAFDAMVKSAMGNSSGLSWYKKLHYVAADSEVESVSKTLEYCYDDWCIARTAQALGRTGIAKTFTRRSEYFKNLFDTTSGFMRGKLTDGSWRSPFDPVSVNHRANDYTEGNAWQYSWFVPHDVSGLISLMGGREKFIAKLDSLFERSSALKGEHISADISGMVGQYAQGNEPSHHIAYLYDYAGVPWKTEERVSTIVKTLYDNTPAGLCGNEDCGQMSAWYIFSTLGFYPVNPADQIYVIGTPAFNKAEIHLGNGKTFVVEAPNVSPKNIYIQSAALNGRPFRRTFITHSEIINGGTLSLTMSDIPSRWGSHFSDTPPSYSPQSTTK